MAHRPWVLFTIFVLGVMTGPAGAQDITTGLVGQWKLDETSGTLAADSSGNANDGTYTGGPTLGAAAPRMFGAYFPTDGKYVTAPASTTLNALGVSNADFSAAFWVKPAGTNGGWRPLIHKGAIDFERGPGVWLNPGDNRVHFRVTTTANNNDGTDTSVSLPNSVWSHIACVKAGNKWRCYINGVLNTELTLSAGSTGNSGPFYIGDDPWYAGSNVYMDEVRLYSRALTAADIGVLCEQPIASRLLMVVIDSSSLTAQELLRRAAFQDWGYTVTTISETASQATFDSNAAANDVAYICETVNSANLSTKLKNKPLGVVNANAAMANNFAVASTTSTPSGTDINIGSNTHYLTSGWSIGSLTITTASQTLMTVSGTIATEQSTLASISGVKSLVVVEIGGKLNDGTTAYGRRVQLPWGGSAFDFSALNANGVSLLKRALAWAGGVVGYWKLDESSGTVAADSSVNAHVGTVTNTSFTTGQVGTAKVNGGLTFDGTTAYISAPNTPDLQLTKAMSMSAWIKGSGTWGAGSSCNSIIRKGDANPNNYQFAIENGYVALGLDGNDGANAHGNTLLAIGTWYHVAATWDGSNIRIYVNGVLDGSPAARAAPIATDARDLYLGGRIGNADIFNGVLDELRLYNYALSQDEITALTTQGLATGVRITKWVETP